MRVNKTVSLLTASEDKERSGRRQRIAVLAVLALLAACESAPEVPLGQPGHVRGFGGMVAAEEPRAALVARDVLSAGGGAADAAAAAALTMAVTLPSSAALGGGGVCVSYNAARDEAGVLDFMPPAGVPGLPRGIFALHAKHGRLRWEEVVVPAENLARFGTRTARALLHDAAAAPAGPASQFFRSLREGEPLSQIELAVQLARLRVKGPGELHAGEGADALVREASAQGVAIDPAALREFVPQWLQPASIRAGDDVALLHPRSGLAAGLTGGADGQPRDPARAGLAVMDGDGNLVACTLTMGRPFGTGRAVSGMLLADLSAAAPPPVAVMANRNTKEPRLAIAAAVETAVAGAIQGRAGRSPQPLAQLVPAGSDANAVACISGTPSAARCQTVTDPSASGLSLVVGEN